MLPDAGNGQAPRGLERRGEERRPMFTVQCWGHWTRSGRRAEAAPTPSWAKAVKLASVSGQLSTSTTAHGEGSSISSG
jgi:hypothetical protein